MYGSLATSSTPSQASRPPRLRWAVASVSFLTAGLLLGGCAALQPKTPEETVAQRAEERWKLMMADKFEQSYEYTAPSYRALKEYKAYRLGYGPASAWMGAKVVKVTCASEENCNAVLEVTVKNLTPIRSTANLATALDETWVREGGRWYVLPAL